MNTYRFKMKGFTLKASDREEARHKFRKIVLRDYGTFHDFVKERLKVTLEEGFEFGVIQKKQ